jgi:Virus neck protein
MPTNQFFNFFPEQVTSEQLLVEDLVIEANRIHGMDVYYLPRESRDQIDRLMGEEQLKTFDRAYTIEMYLENVSGMEGEGDLISKFGLEIRDEMTMLVSRRRFQFTIPELARPREGDLIYIPLVQNFMEITFVEHENNQAMFYTLGRGRGGNVYVYALRMKQFVFSNEQIQTGTAEVDDQILESYQLVDLVLSSGTGAFDVSNNEIVYQGANVAYANAFGTAHTWNVATATLSIALVNGLFSNTANVKGANSGAQWIMTSLDTDTPLENQFEELADNKRIETESNAILDFSEQNPFGEP